MPEEEFGLLASKVWKNNNHNHNKNKNNLNLKK